MGAPEPLPPSPPLHVNEETSHAQFEYVEPTTVSAPPVENLHSSTPYPEQNRPEVYYIVNEGINKNYIYLATFYIGIAIILISMFLPIIITGAGFEFLGMREVIDVPFDALDLASGNMITKQYAIFLVLPIIGIVGIFMPMVGTKWAYDLTTFMALTGIICLGIGYYQVFNDVMNSSDVYSLHIGYGFIAMVVGGVLMGMGGAMCSTHFEPPENAGREKRF
jgi:hypothetical protein